MDKRHKAELQTALDPLAYKRFAALSRKEFRYWTGYERINKGAWKILINHLPAGVLAGDISVVENDDDILLVFTKELSPLTNQI